MSVIVRPIHMKMTPGRNYTYVVYDSLHKDSIIVDPTGDIEIIEEFLDGLDLNLKAILITHTHTDHISLVGTLVDKYDCNVWVSNIECKYISIDAKKIKKIGTETPLPIGHIKVTPIFTPGHTLGSICFLVDSNLFTGDTLFIEGCGMCVGSNSDPALLFNSLMKLKKCISADTKVYPGHIYGYGVGQPFEFLLKNNIYLQFAEDQKDLFIAFRMRKSQTKLYNFC